jgi:hypothetical protein
MASGQVNQLMKPLRKMRSRRLSHGNGSSVGPDSVAATSLSDIAGPNVLPGPVGRGRRRILRSRVALLAEWRNRSDKWTRLNAQSPSPRSDGDCVLSPVQPVSSVIIYGLAHLQPYGTVASTEGGGRHGKTPFPKATLNPRPFRFP